MVDALLSKFKDFLTRMFDIRVGEFRRVGLMQLNVFLLILCLWIIKPVVNAQFLSRVGIDQLPLVFLLVALTALAVSTAYSRLLNRMALGKIMLRTYLVSIACLLTFATLINLDLFRDWMSYVFYIGVALFGLITTSQFWLLGNLVFSSLEAKRLFGFIGAGAIGGGIGGGYLTSILAPLMDGQNLLFVASFLLLISMGINLRIWMTYVPSFNQSIQKRQAKSIHEFPFRLIRNSKHLTYLALIMGISVVVAKLVEFQFSAIASANIQDPDKLTAFFGFWFSTSNVVSLGIQLLVTQRVVAYLGVGKSLFVLPGALFVGAATVLYTPVLWASTALKLFDISLKQSINKATTELLILPIPMAIKSQAKTFIDVFVDTSATGIGGIMLIFIINGMDLSVRAVCIMILLLIFLWIYFAVRVRKEYVKAFREKLGNIRSSPKKKEGDAFNASVADGIRRTLRTGTSKQILFLLTRIEESKDQRLMPDVVPLLKHDFPEVRQAALRCLYYHTDHSITRDIEPLLKDPDDEVRSRAFSSLLAQTRNDRVKFIEDYLKDKDPVIQGAALVGLATEARDNPEMKHLFHLEQLLREKISQIGQHDEEDEINALKNLVARAIGYGKLEGFYPLLMEYMKDINVGIRKQAILSAGSSQDPGFVKILVSLMPSKSTRSATRKALARYEPSEILPILAEMSRDKRTLHEVLVQLPSLMETMDSQQAVDFLFELAQHTDSAVRIEALESLYIIKEKFPHLLISNKSVIHILSEEARLYKVTLALSYAVRRSGSNYANDEVISRSSAELINLFERRLTAIIERMFWVLGLKYPSGIILPLYKDVNHQDSTIRINAVELLDNILLPAHKKIFMPMLETAMLEAISEADLTRLELEVPSEDSSFESILSGDDDLLKLSLLSLIKRINDPKFRELVEMATEDENTRVKSYAEKMLRKE